MIELGQFFLNSATMSEAITNEVGEDKKEELALDPDSFIVLMAQMLPDAPPTLPSKNTLGTSAQGEELAQSQDNPIDSMDEVNQNALERLDTHGALAWINSENYQPPKQVEQINPESFEALTNQSAIPRPTLESYLPSKPAFNESLAQSTPQVESADETLASENLESTRSSFFDTALEEDGIFISHQSEDTIQAESDVQASSKQKDDRIVSAKPVDKAVVSTTPTDITKIQLPPSGLEDSALVNMEMLTPVQQSKPLEVESFAELKPIDNAPIQPLVDKNQVDARAKFTDSSKKNQEIGESMKPLFVAKQGDMSFESVQQKAKETKFEHSIELNATTQPKDKRLTSINPYKDIIPPSKADSQTPVKIESGIANQLVETLQPVISPTATQPNWSVTASTPKALEIPAALGSPEWADQFSEQVVWVGQSSFQSAVIKIHPEDLGPLEISVKVVDDLASVTITSHSSHVREMVDQALPRLREMMAENGLNLSNTSIGSDGKSRQSSQQQGNSEQDSTGYAADEKLLSSSSATAAKKASKGLVDYFA